MIRPANSAAQPEPVSRQAIIATRAAAAVIAITEGIRITVGLVPTTIQPCISR